MQLEHNVQEYSDLLNSDSLDDKADESPEQAILRHARHQSPAIGHSVTGHTDNTDTGHTGHIGTGHIGTGHTRSTGHTGQHRSKRQHSVHRTHSVRSDADDHRSTLINCTLQQHRLDLEYRSAADRSRLALVHLGRIVAHTVQLFLFDMLTQVNFLRPRCSGIVVSGVVPALTTLSLRDVIVVPLLVREGRKRSHTRRGSTLPLLVLLAAAHPLLLEKDQSTGIYIRRRRNTLAHTLRSVISM